MYEKLDENEKLIVRDYLALERTKLANTRTLLAWVRSAVALFATGVGLVELLDHLLLARVGLVFVWLSPLVLIGGFVHYFLVCRRWRWLK